MSDPIYWKEPVQPVVCELHCIRCNRVIATAKAENFAAAQALCMLEEGVETTPAGAACVGSCWAGMRGIIDARIRDAFAGNPEERRARTRLAIERLAAERWPGCSVSWATPDRADIRMPPPSTMFYSLEIPETPPPAPDAAAPVDPDPSKPWTVP